MTPFKQEIDIPASALGFSASYVAPYSTTGNTQVNMNFVAMKQFSKYTVTTSGTMRYWFNGAEQSETKTFDISNMDTFYISVKPGDRASGFTGGTVSGAATKKS
ncbi:MAG: hypothetical protein HDQ99_19400 [Lachnospiraceae bacterium]|nr:hypothetical protein [Lachnospiraceae bacterium]